MKVSVKLSIALIATSLSIIVGSLILAYLVALNFERSMMERAEVITSEFVSRQARLHLTESDFLQPNGDPAGPMGLYQEQIRTHEIIRIKVWSLEGQVIYSDAKQIVGKVYADNLNLQRALRGERVVSIKSTENEENEAESAYAQLMEIYVPISIHPPRVVGAVEVYVNLDLVNAEIRRVNRLIVLFNAVAIAGMGLLGWLGWVYLNRTIVRRLMRLKDASQRVAAGDFSQRVSIQSRDEIGELADAFNHMVSDLDASHRKIVEDKQYLDGILASMNDALAVVGPDGTIRSANPALARLAGVPPGALVGQGIATLFADGPVPVPDGRSLMNPHGQERTCISSDGQHIPVLFSSSPLRTTNGRQGEIVCVAQDISVRKAMERRLIEHNRQMDEDVRSAAEFQRAVLPKPQEFPFADVAVRYLPLNEVSGDIYDLSLNNSGDLCGFLGDATGHGVSAALLTMMVQIGLDSVNQEEAADRIAEQLNNLLSTHDTGKFLTGVYFRLAPDGTLRLANAAHPPVLILPADGSKCVLLNERGLPLGLFRSASVPYVEERYRLQPGDKAILYTDGVIEWPGSNGNHFGQRALLDFLSRHRELGVEKLLHELLGYIRDVSLTDRSVDDLTVLGIQFRG